MSNPPTHVSSEKRTPDLGADAPDHNVEIDANALLTRLVRSAPDHRKDFEKNRRRFFESLNYSKSSYYARYAMREDRGGQQAYSMILGELQPGGQFRNKNRTVALGELLQELREGAESAHEASQTSDASPSERRHAAGARSAFAEMNATIRDEFGVGWPRRDDSGNPIQKDLP